MFRSCLSYAKIAELSCRLVISEPVRWFRIWIKEVDKLKLFCGYQVLLPSDYNDRMGIYGIAESLKGGVIEIVEVSAGYNSTKLELCQLKLIWSWCDKEARTLVFFSGPC